MFASAFLMPAGSVASYLPTRAPNAREWQRMLDSRRHWGVSAKALLYRARELGAIAGPYFCATVGAYRLTAPGLELPYSFTDMDSGAWDERTVPTPAGTTAASLDDVYCQSSLACMAVGDHTNAGVKAFASVWNGSAWSTRTPLNAPGSTYNSLTGVSCPVSSLDCIAAGHTVVGGVSLPLIQRWNGSSWTIHTSPLPAGASYGWVSGLSCTNTSPITCMAVGVAGGEAYVVRWGGSGTTWTAETAPRPAFATSVSLEDVSCTSPTACTAVGSYAMPGGVRESYAASWDGVAWEVHVTPNPGTADNALLGVSCVSSTVCRAVGYARGGGGSFNLAATLG